jgi:hypothetical protein
VSIDDALARFDWSRLPTYAGHAEMIPHAISGLIAAPDKKEATRLGVWIERILLSVAGPCEACAPVATVLVAALPEMTPPAHSVALDLLAQISAAEISGPAHEQIGKVDAKEIRRAVAAGFQHYVAVLRAESSSEADLYPCVDLMDILAFHDRTLTAEAVSALEAVQTPSRPTNMAAAIANTLEDLADPPNI